jgi:hypothetical protein
MVEALFLIVWGDAVSKSVVGDDIDQSGTAIFSLLQQAVETSRAECDRANQTAHEYALQLRAANDLVKQLQIKVAQLEERARRAEDWLHHIRNIIEDKFFRNDGEQRSLG